MRNINEIIVHCSETRPDQDISAADIDLWHRRKGWDGIGYHFLIRIDGTIEPGRPIKKIGAHCYGHNNNSIGICYAGGVIRNGDTIYYTDTRTPAQVRALYLLIVTLLHCYPSINKISGHRDYAKKACPCFDAKAEYEYLLKHLKSNKLFLDQ